MMPVRTDEGDKFKFSADVQGKVLTNQHRAVRGLEADPTCPRCLVGIEDIDHLVRGCIHSIEIWAKTLDSCFLAASYVGTIDEWMAENLKNKSPGPGNIPHYLIFACTLWFMWKWRCKRAFDSCFSPTPTPQLVIHQFAKDWLSANGDNTVREDVNVMVGWLPPSEDWVKLNTDGSCDKNSGQISAGGVLRDSQKNWVRGFVAKRGVGSVLDAELWAIFEGLSLAWNCGIRKIVAETDSLEAVQLLNAETNINHPLFSLLQNCKQLMEAGWDCKLNHVYREGNRLADRLAHMGHNLSSDMVILDAPPADMLSIFDEDCNGFRSVRQCAAPVSVFV